MSATVASDVDAVLASMMTRRSVGSYGGGSVSDEQISILLRAATTVPDHGALRPWRLVVVSGEARAAFGAALVDAGRQAKPYLADETAERLRSKAFVAPALIAVVARIDRSSSVPEWEQVASAACTGYAITLAAHAIGLGAMWKSSPFQEGDLLGATLDMAEGDVFLGWVNVGPQLVDRVTAERSPVDLTDIARVLDKNGVPQPY